MSCVLALSPGMIRHSYGRKKCHLLEGLERFQRNITVNLKSHRTTMGDQGEEPTLQDDFDEHCGGADGLTRKETFDLLCIRCKFPTAFDIAKHWKDNDMGDDDLLGFDSLQQLHDSLGSGEIRLTDALAVFDTNGDGEFDKEELKVMLKAIDNSTYDLYADNGSEWDTFIDNTFSAGDTDGSGKISTEELVQLLTDVTIKVTDEGVNQSTDASELNDDGKGLIIGAE